MAETGVCGKDRAICGKTAPPRAEFNLYGSETKRGDELAVRSQGHRCRIHIVFRMAPLILPRLVISMVFVDMERHVDQHVAYMAVRHFVEDLL